MKGIEKEREMIKEVAAKTAQKVIQPKTEEIDRTGQFPVGLVDTFGKQGLLSVLLPEEYGGTNGDVTSFCFVIEEIAKVSGAASLLILAQGVATLPVLLGGNPAQQELYFTRVSDKNSLMAVALSEHGEGFSTA